jgi:hypothetical protein
MTIGAEHIDTQTKAHLECTKFAPISLIRFQKNWGETLHNKWGQTVGSKNAVK